MGFRSTQGRVVPVHDLCDYFRSSIDAAVAQQSVTVDPHATHYVVSMMTSFSRSENLYENDGENYGIKPLALMLADATEAPNAEERNRLLRRIGDVALFVSGFFANHLANKAVDIDYYMAMGESAYGVLSEEARGTFRGNAFADVWCELASKFRILTDVLHEVRDHGRPDSSMSLMRQYEVWLKTGSQRAERLLRQQGIVPIATPGIRRH
jgi:hypothetical protein